MITVSPFTKSYHGRTVLNFPAFSFEPSHIYAVIGSNGSGKSTFAKVLAGIEKADSATRPLSSSVNIGYLPQKPYAFHMTLRKNILLNKEKNSSDNESRAEELIRAFELTALAEKNGSSLSGGETARMALARLMMKEYSLLILDEPTAAIDMNNTLRAEQVIREYTHRTKASVLLITHSLKQALRLSDTVLYLENGNLIEQGGTAAVLNEPSTMELRRFLDFYSLD
ncbi:MAG: ABC transporter ATP-binding protein [Blautia sp.]|nr:ABC transporter ATP-binding protein [Eubacteriales bacterium]MED9966771.1 ABC transporter ATP-binding protein [Blautia sp.]